MFRGWVGSGGEEPGLRGGSGTGNWIVWVRGLQWEGLWVSPSWWPILPGVTIVR